MIAQDIPATIESTILRGGADSVFEYVQRTAERVPDGARWQTLSYEGQPHYSNRLYNGVAGIAVFLADHHAVTGSARARELAELALRWSSSAAQMADADARPFRGSAGMRHSLLVGTAGLAYAWLHLARATGERTALERACGLAHRILADEPGPFLYVLSGAAGEGLLCLELWDATRDERFLARAVHYGELIESHALRDERGVLWPARDPAAVPPPGGTFAGGVLTPTVLLGYGFGLAGVAQYLARLYRATGDPRWSGLTREAADTLRRLGVADRGGTNWPVDTMRQPDTGKRLCHWCRGAPGTGLCLVECAAALGDPSYLELAEHAGECTYAYGDARQNPSLCHGLSGNAALFLALHRATGRQTWSDRANDFAWRALAYRQVTAEGDAWQTDEPGAVSPDLMCGASGVGHFFLRLLAPDRVRLPFM